MSSSRGSSLSFIINEKTNTEYIVNNTSDNPNVSVAVLLPCYNEEVTIGKVVRDFKTALPNADIYVYDNNSTDRTAEIATAEGAIVRRTGIGHGYTARLQITP